MTCPICNSSMVSIGTLPFDRNNSGYPVIDTTPMEYFKCTKCYYVCCPEMLAWSAEKLGEKVYNKEYILYDPDYTFVRPNEYAKFFIKEIDKSYYSKLKHLDYGSGSGVMADILRKQHGWRSKCYDPYSSTTKPTTKFDLITAIEVVEHSSNIIDTILDMKKYLNPRGIIAFSTRLANKDTDISWWYLGTRGGHISMVSMESMRIIAERTGMHFISYGEGFHILSTSKVRHRSLLGWADGNR